MPNTEYTIKEYETILNNYKPFYDEDYFKKEQSRIAEIKKEN